MASGYDTSKVSLFAETFLTCRHCKKLYTRPTILVCSHTFCKDCLAELLLADETVTCPSCQENILLPKKGIEALKSNTFVEFLLKYVHLLKTFGSPSELKGKCKLCECEDIKVYCQECSGAICNVCETQHERMKPFKGHTVLQLSDMLQMDVTDVIGMLSKGAAEEECPNHHGEPLRFFCQRCNTTVCRDCTVVEHNTGDHRVTALDEITDSRRRRLEDGLEKLKKRRERNSNFVNGKEESMRNLLDQKLEISNAIENITKEVIDKINSQKAALLDQLEKVTAAKLTGNEKIFEAAENDHDKMNDCCAVSELLLATARDADIIQVANEFYHDIKKQNLKVENFSFAPQLSRLGIIFKAGVCVDDLHIGRIVPAQYKQEEEEKTSPGWVDIEESFRGLSTAFWNSLKD
ncbi:E3 ubiquitin-protein ligase TRIM56-like [Apostichopus japonicus]